MDALRLKVRRVIGSETSTVPEGMRADHLLCVALIAAVDGDPAALRAARGLLQEALDEPTWLSSSGHGPDIVDLGRASMAGACAIASEWLGADLPGELRAGLAARANEEVFTRYVRMRTEDSFPLDRYQDNWCAVVAGWTGVAAHLFHDDAVVAPEALGIALQQVEGILDSAPEDGGWPEGVKYWSYALRPVQVFAQVHRERTGEDLFEHPFWRKTGDFILYMYVPTQYFANLSDSSTRGASRTVVRKLASETGRSDLQWLSQRCPPHTTAIEVLFADTALQPEHPPALPKSRHFAGIDVASLRSGWGRDSTVIVFRSGRRTGHCHLDLNHFLVHVNGRMLLRDPYTQGYTENYFSPGGKSRYFWSDTVGHNAILMDGEGQVTDLARSASMVRFLSGPHTDYILSDATDAYPFKATKVQRHLLFIRKNLILVVDDLAAQWPAEWTWLGQAGGELGTSGDWTTISRDESTLAIQCLSKDAVVYVKSHPVAKTPPRYVSISAGPPRETEQIVTVLSAHRVSLDEAKLPDVQDRREGELRHITITRHPELHHVLLKEQEDGPAYGVVSYHDDGAGTQRLTGVSSYGLARVTADPTALLRADRPLMASVSHKADRVVGQVMSESRQTLRLWCPPWEGDAGDVLVDGETVPFAVSDGLVSFELEGGLHAVEVRPRG